MKNNELNMNSNFKIPMSKPSIDIEEKKAVQKILESGWVSQGKMTKKFETELSKKISSNVAVVNNGTSALICALLSHGVKSGDRIVVPAFTFIATASAAKILGVEIIPIDIELSTLNMDIKKLEEYVKKNKIKAALIVDVAGLPIDIDAFLELSRRHKFILIEDAAEALGSEYKNKMIGSFEHLTTFSFHIAKIITTIEGGCVVSKNEDMIEKIKQIREHGSNKNEKYVHEVIGSNFRITDLQSAIGIEQLKKIDTFILRRNEIAKKYRKNLEKLEFQIIPHYVTKHTYMLFFALAKNMEERDIFIKKSKDTGIDCRKPWLPIQNQPCFLDIHNYECNNAMNIFNRAFTIPIYNSMSNQDVEYVINSLN